MTDTSSPQTALDAIAILKPLANRMRIQHGYLNVAVGKTLQDEGIHPRIEQVSDALRVLGGHHVEIKVGRTSAPAPDLPAGAASRELPGVHVSCCIRSQTRGAPDKATAFAPQGLDLTTLADHGINFSGSSHYCSPSKS